MDKEGVGAIVNITIHLIGTWNGTGACDGTGMHHGEAECFNDAYKLAADAVDASKSFAFTRCMFERMGELCPASWTGKECAKDAYNATSFQPAAEACEAEAGYEAGTLAKLALGDGGGVSSWAASGIAADLAYSAKADPGGTIPPPEGGPAPAWIVVGDSFVSDRDSDDEAAWAAKVLAAVCDAYDGAEKPAGCPSL